MPTIQIERKWETKHHSPLGHWHGIRADQDGNREAFTAPDEETFDTFLDPTCSCTFATRNSNNCAIHHSESL